MENYGQAVNHQYGQDDLRSKILTALQKAGKDVERLTREDLSTFDEFHIGGIAETRRLASLAGLREGMRVLDVGSGLGGPARTLAAEFGCRVTGLDLTEAFCIAAEGLTRRVGLGDKIEFRRGNALDMPFEDSAFDVVWTQFAGMNIADKERLYAEVRRVLRPGGVFAFHEVMRGATDELHYPVFWANEPSISFLRPPEDIRRILASKGFQEKAWNDLSHQSVEWFRAMVERAAKEGPPPLGFQVFIADSVPVKAQNLVRNLEEGRVTVIQGVYELAK
jgi:ubiquinone/menaquinone biosynthesis C-methylase UbiE